MLSFEDQVQQEGFQFIIGIDEAGRGPLAGPVVASAVLLQSYQFECIIRDSKKMTARQRVQAHDEIMQKGFVGIGLSDVECIDKENILQATFHAMTKAVQDLFTKMPQEDIHRAEFSKKVCLLVDGSLFKTTLPFVYKTIIRGDSLSLSIACASIMAKVTRDRLMEDYDKLYPRYGLAQHKGYPTSKHKELIKAFGLSPIHRKTFKYWK
jgi:ribonuclease HII